MATVTEIPGALEQDKAAEAALVGKKYQYILGEPYRWEAWAAPLTADGKLDHNAATTCAT